MEDQLEHFAENLRLRLDGVTHLDEDAQSSFESTTKDWSNKIYESESPHFRRLRRSLQLNGVVNFDTEVSFRSQHTTRDGAVIFYDQYVSYGAKDNSTTLLNPLTVLITPFNHPILGERYKDELRISNPQFKNIPERSVVVPDPEFVFKGSGDDDGDEPGVFGRGQGSGTMLALALLSAIVFLLAIVLILILRRRRKARKTHGHAPKFLARQGSSSFGFASSEVLQDEPLSSSSGVLAMMGGSGFRDAPASFCQEDVEASTDHEISSSTPTTLPTTGPVPPNLAIAPPPTFSDFTAEIRIEDAAFSDILEPSVELFAEPLPDKTQDPFASE